MNNKKLTIFFVFIFLFAINIVAWAKVYDLNQPQDFKVVFFDVGQGDSVLIKTHLGHYILIDGGENSLILEKLSKEIPFYEKNLMVYHNIIILRKSFLVILYSLILQNIRKQSKQ